MENTSPISSNRRVRSANGLWQPERTGKYAADYAWGRAYARRLIHRIITEEKPFLLGDTIRDMIAGGVYGAVEIGFCSTIAMAIDPCCAPGARSTAEIDAPPSLQ